MLIRLMLGEVYLKKALPIRVLAILLRIGCCGSLARVSRPSPSSPEMHCCGMLRSVEECSRMFRNAEHVISSAQDGSR